MRGAVYAVDSYYASTNNPNKLAIRLDESLVKLSREMSNIVKDVDQLLYSTRSNLSIKKFQLSDIQKMRIVMNDIVTKSKKIIDENWQVLF